ncbi:hypothetical protein [Pseudomonas corrugata]|uniref:hypothetical protein n=1 Tax=Pseudomonas corrugata TaxID=47879 RepID=UPI0006D8CB1E|nr:hypothetical protein [Pseudomonas corrugata]
MKKMYWILRAALYMRSVMGWWKPTDLVFCWKTGATIYDNYEYEGRLSEIGEPAEEMAEELSCWSE